MKQISKLPIIIHRLLLITIIGGVLLSGQGCVQTPYIFSDAGIGKSSTTNVGLTQGFISAEGGNGMGYDGKLTFLHVENGFTCENMPAPKAILRRDANKAWKYSVNERLKCADESTSIPVFDIFFTLGSTYLQYRQMEFHLDNMAPDSPISLSGYLRYWNVDPRADQSTKDNLLGDNKCENSMGLCSLQAAIDETNNSPLQASVILLPNGNISLRSNVFVNSSSQVLIRGQGKLNSVLDGAGVSGGMFAVWDPTMQSSLKIFEDFSIQNSGSSISNGTAINLWSGSATLNRMLISSNLSGSGVNVEVGGKSLLVRASTISNHQGPGIYAYGADEIIIEGSSISNNVGHGLNYRGPIDGVFVRNSSVLNNQGFGISIQECFSGCVIENTTVYGNTWSGIYLENRTYLAKDFFIRNSTVVGNALTSGANLTIDMSPLGSPTGIYLQNSILAQASGGRPNCEIISLNNVSLINQGSLLDTNTCPGTGYIIADPLLFPLANNGGLTPTFLPQAGSPAIDAGDNSVCAAADQRGSSRPVDKLGGGARCDIGAVEVQ